MRKWRIEDSAELYNINGWLPGLSARDREKDRQRGLLVWVVSDLLHEKR